MRIIILILFFAVQLILTAQYRTEFIRVPEGGIPLDLTYCMMQDSRGFIWFGTMYGLICYDGNEYKTYRHDPDDTNSISFDDIISISEDKNGNLWIGTWGGSVNVLNYNKGTFTRLPS